MLSRFAARPTFQLAPGSYIRALQLGDAVAVARLWMSNPHTLQAEIVAQHGSVDSAALEHSIRAISGTGHDLSDFYARAAANPALWPWLQPLAGMPVFYNPDLYEALFTTVIEQHISWAAALRIQRRFAELFGQPMATPSGVMFAPPAPQQIAELTRAELAPLKLTTARLDLLIHISQLIASGAFNGWQQSTPETLYQELLAVKGIGHWTATVAVGRALGVQPYLHDNDVALQAAVNAYLLGKSGRASLQDTRATFTIFGSDAPLVAHFLMMRWVIDRYQPHPFDL